MMRVVVQQLHDRSHELPRIYVLRATVGFGRRLGR
jgi:hypothetical protein